MAVAGAEPGGYSHVPGDGVSVGHLVEQPMGASDSAVPRVHGRERGNEGWAGGEAADGVAGIDRWTHADVGVRVEERLEG